MNDLKIACLLVIGVACFFGAVFMLLGSGLALSGAFSGAGWRALAALFVTIPTLLACVVVMLKTVRAAEDLA